MITEQYIDGYVKALSDVKMILTPYLGGVNRFFSIPFDKKLNTVENIRLYLTEHKEYYLYRMVTEERFQTIIDSVTIKPMDLWETNLKEAIGYWTSKRTFTELTGYEEDVIAEILVRDLLSDFFSDMTPTVYRLFANESLWPWGDYIGDEFVFVTETGIYILHFGESS